MRTAHVWNNLSLESRSQQHVIRYFYTLDNLTMAAIDLIGLYILFSHFRPRDATRGNSFFQMSCYARANLRITNEKNKRKIPMRASRGLKLENKMYKLKRSIETMKTPTRLKNYRLVSTRDFSFF